MTRKRKKVWHTCAHDDDAPASTLFQYLLSLHNTTCFFTTTMTIHPNSSNRNSRSLKRCSVSPGPNANRRQQERSRSVRRRGRSTIRSEHHSERCLTPAPFRIHQHSNGNGGLRRSRVMSSHASVVSVPQQHQQHAQFLPHRTSAPARIVDDETLSTASSTASGSQFYGSLKEHYCEDDLFALTPSNSHGSSCNSNNSSHHGPYCSPDPFATASSP